MPKLAYLDQFFFTERSRSHAHSCVEIGLVRSGALLWTEAKSGTKGKSLQSGDLVIVPAHCLHYESPVSNRKAQVTFFGIRGLKGEAYCRPSFYSLPPGHSLRLILTQMVDEFRTQNESRREALDHWLKLLILSVERLFALSERKHFGLSETKTPSASGHEDLVRRAMDVIDNQFHLKELSLTRIAQTLGVSGRTLQMTFRKEMNATPLEVVTSCRMRFALDRLQQREESLAELSRACGYESVSYFLRRFKCHHGMTPTQFRIRGGLQNASPGHQKTLRPEANALPSYRKSVLLPRK